MEIKWEEIKQEHGGYLYRSKIHGGWLVKYTEDVLTKINAVPQVGYEWKSSITFVPDPKHEWK